MANLAKTRNSRTNFKFKNNTTISKYSNENPTEIQHLEEKEVNLYEELPNQVDHIKTQLQLFQLIQKIFPTSNREKNKKENSISKNFSSEAT